MTLFGIVDSDVNLNHILDDISWYLGIPTCLHIYRFEEVANQKNVKVIWQLLQREASWIILQFWEETSERLFRSCRSCTDCLPFSISSDHQRSKTLWSFKRRHVDNSDDDSNDAQLQFVSSSYYNVLCAVFHVQSAQYIFGTFWHFLVIFSFFCWLFLFGCLWSMTSSQTRKKEGNEDKD